jgi:hypothetical protein
MISRLIVVRPTSERVEFAFQQSAYSPKRQKHRFDSRRTHNFVGLVAEELPTIPQVVVIDLTMDPFQTTFY